MLRAVDFSHVHEHVSCVVHVLRHAFSDEDLLCLTCLGVVHASRSLTLSCLSDSGNTASRLSTSCLKNLPSINLRQVSQRSAWKGTRGTESLSSSHTSSSTA